MMIKTLVSSLCLSISIGICASDLKPFESDGCSAFPDGPIGDNELWMSCCIEHDLSYWLGGTKKQRLQSDQRLRECVADIGKPEIGAIMLAGVQVGGSPYFPTKYCWAYG